MPSQTSRPSQALASSPQASSESAIGWSNGKAAAPAVDVDRLDAAARQEEIARMLAGASVTEQARAAAASLLQGARP